MTSLLELPALLQRDLCVGDVLPPAQGGLLGLQVLPGRGIVLNLHGSQAAGERDTQC
jgi:hypothetical protein